MNRIPPERYKLKTSHFIEDIKELCHQYWDEDYDFELKNAKLRGYRGGFRLIITFDHEEYKLNDSR